MNATLIQCTNSKREERCKAKHLYDESAYFRKMKAYAQAKGDEWYILSGKHGLLDPLARIEPYNAVGISEQQATEIAAQLVDLHTNTVEIVAGEKYTQHLVPELERKGIDTLNNFAGLGIGERMAELDARRKQLENETLV